MFLSLPVAFLLWSVLLFAVSVVAYAWNRLPATYSAIGVTTTLGLVTIITIGLSSLHRWKWLIRYKKNGNGSTTLATRTSFGPKHVKHPGSKGIRDSLRINLDDAPPGSPKKSVGDDARPTAKDGETGGAMEEKRRSQVGSDGPLRLLDEAETA